MGSLLGNSSYAHGWNEANRKAASWMREESEKKEAHENIIREVEKATGKKHIIVDGDEYYVDRRALENLINGGSL